jgi:hypothetical protein
MTKSRNDVRLKNDVWASGIVGRTGWEASDLSRTMLQTPAAAAGVRKEGSDDAAVEDQGSNVGHSS